jgi:hypothetical protein
LLALWQQQIDRRQAVDLTAHRHAGRPSYQPNPTQRRSWSDAPRSGCILLWPSGDHPIISLRALVFLPIMGSRLYMIGHRPRLLAHAHSPPDLIFLKGRTSIAHRPRFSSICDTLFQNEHPLGMAAYDFASQPATVQAARQTHTALPHCALNHLRCCPTDVRGRILIIAVVDVRHMPRTCGMLVCLA